MSGKNNIEGKLKDNTYGIEIEFATHNCQMLSFTHIEVWNLYPDPDTYKTDSKKCIKCGWKIETDSGYTLELVSPILQFKTHIDARKFKSNLMDFLQKKVQEGILLPQLTRDFREFVNKSTFTYDEVTGFWTYTPDQQAGTIKLTEKFINNKELHDELVSYNLDEITHLQTVLDQKKSLNEPDGVIFWENELKKTNLTPSEKNDGVPSSQMNIPLTLHG